MTKEERKRLEEVLEEYKQKAKVNDEEKCFMAAAYDRGVVNGIAFVLAVVHNE